jgi:hypothetical protein
MSETLKMGKLGTPAKDVPKSAGGNDPFKKLAVGAGSILAGIVLATACTTSSKSTTTKFDVKPDANKMDVVSGEVGADVDGELYVPTSKTCAEKEADGKTVYVITLNGSKTKVAEGDTVEENGQKYKVTLNEEGSVVLKAVNANGEEQPYKVTVGGETYTVYDGETIIYKGETCMVDVENKLLLRLNAKGETDGVVYEVASVESSDVSKDTTSYTTSYYFGKYVVEISGLEGDVTSDTPDRAVLCERDGAGCSTSLEIKGVDGVTGTVKMTEKTDFEGNQIAEYSYLIPGESNNLGPFEVSMVLGATIQMGDNVKLTVKSAGPKVHGDPDCQVVKADLEVREDGTAVPAHVPEGESVPVSTSSTVKVGHAVPAVGDSPFCAQLGLTTEPSEGKTMFTDGVFCQGDAKSGLSRDEGKATVILKGVTVVNTENGSQ